MSITEEQLRNACKDKKQVYVLDRHANTVDTTFYRIIPVDFDEYVVEYVSVTGTTKVVVRYNVFATESEAWREYANMLNVRLHTVMNRISDLETLEAKE